MKEKKIVNVEITETVIKKVSLVMDQDADEGDVKFAIAGLVKKQSVPEQTYGHSWEIRSIQDAGAPPVVHFGCRNCSECGYIVVCTEKNKQVVILCTLCRGTGVSPGEGSYVPVTKV